MERHEYLLRCGVFDVPQRADDRGNTGTDERPHERRNAFGADRKTARAAARREHDETSVLEWRKRGQERLGVSGPG